MFVDTCFDIRTIGINGAFGSTVWWIAIIIRQTFTLSNTILIIALSKLTARWRFARIIVWDLDGWMRFGENIEFIIHQHKNRIKKLMCTWNGIALVLRISGVSLLTSANRIVINNIAFGILAARTGTWINTFAIIAGAIVCAFRINDTFWPTLRWRARVFR